ncbi:carbamoyltransferase HypF [Catellatospora methionotrophica]|uniref:carbamoyltransferase HypF n=1 Tax=Catellatospora methionotrophica TaxID=121620 RepID=UPI0033E9120F
MAYGVIADETANERLAVRVAGVVQGVGFRPFVYTLAQRLHLRGHVGNDTEGVFIEAEGPRAALDVFLCALDLERPPLAVIDSMTAAPLPVTGAPGFSIMPSDASGPPAAQVAPDAATCEACLDETTGGGGRRQGYAFTNCTHCGPRFTIVRNVPYDRPHTTMAGFAMCGDCAGEYADPADRRFHAQPVCCPACGPRLSLLSMDGSALLTAGADPVAATARLLRGGAIVAIKGLGGYHLAVDATHPEAAARLRAAKHREDKPFALMVADLSEAAGIAEVEPAAARLLRHPARPIVLLPRRTRHPAHRIAEAVAPGCGELGLMLPYTPLHHLLLATLVRPLVMTSGNVSDEPIAYRDDDALTRLTGIADVTLTHDRPIHLRTDDSVARVVRGAPTLLRRSRGYVPRPVRLPITLRRPVLGCGAALKNTFCLARGEFATLSHHVGDLTNAATYRAYTEGVGHFERLLGITPELLAHDLHPDYPSTAYALERDGVETVGVQHHHAHIASCLAEHGEREPVIGVAFDGLGYGDDGTLWGGEILVADLAAYTRVGHLATVPMPGGAAAVREPWRMALSYLDALGGELPGVAVAQRHAHAWRPLREAVRAGVNAPLTSSAGRLFDAVAALLDLRDEVTYEGQAAIELEQVAQRGEVAGYPAEIAEDPVLTLRGADLVRAALTDRLAGVGTPQIAARFHAGVADLIVNACLLVRERHGLHTVALSGGVFQNTLLLGRTLDGLTLSGFRVLTHRQVPCNDGGLSIGQVAVAGARDRR